MYRFNLKNVSKYNLEIVEDYLNKNSTTWYSIEHFASISINNEFENNTNNEHLLEIVELSILHYDIFSKNKKFFNDYQTDFKSNSNIYDYLLISIEEENANRFKRKLENICNISDKRLNKDIDLIDKKIKI